MLLPSVFEKIMFELAIKGNQGAFPHHPYQLVDRGFFCLGLAVRERWERWVKFDRFKEKGYEIDIADRKGQDCGCGVSLALLGTFFQGFNPTAKIKKAPRDASNIQGQ